jgi:hypothetical protein
MDYFDTNRLQVTAGYINFTRRVFRLDDEHAAEKEEVQE